PPRPTAKRRTPPCRSRSCGGEMRAVVQRVKRAKVVMHVSTPAEIAAGLLLFVGVAHQDGPADVEYIVNKTRDLRIFPDDDGRPSRSGVDEGRRLCAGAPR